MRCEVCGKEIKNNISLGLHIKKHGLSSKEYYDKYLKKHPPEGCCEECGNETTFVSVGIGYLRFCCSSCSSKNILTQEKCKRTCNLIYGCDNPFQSEDIKKKICETNIRNLGVPYSTMSQRCIEKQKETKIKKYGSLSYNNLEQRRKTCISKYGVNSFSKTKEFKDSLIGRDTAKASSLSLATKRRNVSQMISLGYTPIQELMGVFGQSWYKNRIVPIEYVSGTGLVSSDNVKIIEECTHSNNRHSSKEENVLNKIIRKYYNGIIIRGDYTILGSQELDFYLPELCLAFEYNGEYWHSDAYKDNDYHFRKSMDCLNKGIRLVHFYSWEDWNEVDKFISQIFQNNEHPTNDFNKFSPYQTYNNLDNIVFSKGQKLYTSKYGYTIYGAGIFYKIDVE